MLSGGRRAMAVGLLLSMASLLVSALAVGAEPNRTVIYFFWGDGCPHCEDEKPFLQDLQSRYPQLQVKDYEVWYHPENQQILAQMARAYGVRATGVPATFIGDSVWVGFSERIKPEISSKVGACIELGCPDPGSLSAAGTGVIKALKETSPLTVPGGAQETSPQPRNLLSIPFLGEYDLTAQPLIFTTGLIALVDGFNPCSLWVLSLLLGIVIYSGSRGKIFAVGFTFLLITAAAYGLFIAGLFNVFAYVGYLGWIQAAVALLALGFALINIKDYFWFKQGISLTIADRYKPRIFKDIRNIMIPNKSLPAMIGATAAMALGITLVELPCTAGFPVLWSNIVAQHHLDTLGFSLLLGLYLLIYLLDELVVFFSVVFTLKASKFEEKHGRLLKLIGGMIMLSLAMVLLVDPELMNDIGGSLLVFGVALLTTLVILVIHRKVLPRYGIRIGTEEIHPK